jgi:hypothetical protein
MKKIVTASMILNAFRTSVSTAKRKGVIPVTPRDAMIVRSINPRA